MRTTAWRRWMDVGIATMALSLVVAGPGFAADESNPASPTAGPPWLGVYTQPLTPELRDEFKVSGSGVLVNRVVPDSPADHAGLRKGDVITTFNTRTVDSPEALAKLVSQAKVGQSVSMRLVRDGKSQSLSAKLAERSDESRMEMAGPEGDDLKGMGREMDEPGPPRDFEFSMPGMFRWLGRGRLGVRVEALNPDLGSYFSVPDGKGALVVGVEKDTPAERAGIKAGDVITKVSDHAVADPEDLVSALGDQEGKVAITVIRKGAKRTIEAELEKPQEHVIRIRRGGDERMRVRDEASSPEMRREMDELRRQIQELKRQMEDLKRK